MTLPFIVLDWTKDVCRGKTVKHAVEHNHSLRLGGTWGLKPGQVKPKFSVMVVEAPLSTARHLKVTVNSMWPDGV